MMRRSIVVVVLAMLAGCAGVGFGDYAGPSERRGAIDHDIGTALPSADQNLRANVPGRPLPIETLGGAPRF